MRAARTVAGRVWLGAWLLLGFASFPLLLNSRYLIRLVAPWLPLGATTFWLAFPVCAAVGLLGWLLLEGPTSGRDAK